MKSINETINILRALEATIIDTQCDISDKERERLVVATFRTIIEAPVKTEAPKEEGKPANA